MGFLQALHDEMGLSEHMPWIHGLLRNFPVKIRKLSMAHVQTYSHFQNFDVLMMFVPQKHSIRIYFGPATVMAHVWSPL